MIHVPPQELRTLIECRNNALSAFNRWETEHPRKELRSEQVFAALGTLYALLPVTCRRRQEDPERRGVQAMHRMLRHLK